MKNGSPARHFTAVGTALLFSAMVTACRRPASPPPPGAEAANTSPTPATIQKTRPPAEPRARATREVLAGWYDLPVNSAAARRGAPSEFTAAHNHFALGTLVRVTHLTSGKSVTVRITDRGIPGRKMKLDLCKQAAEELGMISQGMAKVRMETLSDEGRFQLSARLRSDVSRRRRPSCRRTGGRRD